MARRDLAGRIERVERRHRPSDWSVWLPLDDERGDRVRHTAMDEVATPDDVRVRSGHDIIVEYVDDPDRRAP